MVEMQRSGAVGQSLLSVYSDSATHARQLFGSINQVLLSEMLLLFLHNTCAFSRSKKRTPPGVQPDMIG